MNAVRLLCVILFFSTGCATPPRNCVPKDYAYDDRLVDEWADPADSKTPEDIGYAYEQLTRPPARPKDLARPHAGLDVLALSGGGKFGAYTAGVLVGWSAAGTRPDFGIVTGVSTGSLVATFAFLGKEYDGVLERFYTETTTKDVMTARPLWKLLTADSVFDSKPLAKVIEREIDEVVVAKLASAHAAGRRLYIATTNLDTKRLAIWNLTAIAAGPRPDRVCLIRRLLLASCSPPGGLPPTRIEVTIDGRPYTELHADAGATAELFLRAAMLPINLRQTVPGGRPLEGARLHVIVAGKLFADPECVAPKLFTLASGGITSMAYSMTRSDLVRLASMCMLTGMEYRATALDQKVPVDPNSLKFEPAEMRRLFDEGHADGLTGKGWRNAPPGMKADETNRPRSGTDFRTRAQ